jgi:hypothetical protein
MLLASPLGAAEAGPPKDQSPSLFPPSPELEGLFRQSMITGFVEMMSEAGVSKEGLSLCQKEVERALQGKAMHDFVEIQISAVLNPQAAREGDQVSLDGNVTFMFQMDPIINLYDDICSGVLPRLTPTDRGRSRKVCSN